jgi:hypothetical protein
MTILQYTTSKLQAFLIQKLIATVYLLFLAIHFFWLPTVCDYPLFLTVHF